MGEKEYLENSQIKCYTPYDIECVGGIGNVMTETLKYLKAEKGTMNPIYVTFDIDALDPTLIEGSGTRVRNGLTLREAHFILQRLWDTNNLIGMDMVEVNTELDEEDDREQLHGDIPYFKGK